ncbi:CDP-glycerol glycerophosphotransferase family protein [Microbacterium gorillae]|uniref:CDP-glycerol glycerophosphotransferase family protein n=1 Tax=Microbacterium gorillae TaxID=1231063 RepID=UPI00058B6B3B|nr:CDP-glycerol glycerophosphotransferase family protein [Microbacterium gorillae]
MASFSFDAGNAQKLVRIPLYLAGKLATLVIPRERNWVFGCGAGIGDGPLALFRHARSQGVVPVWLVENDRDEADARALGIPTIHKHSIRGFWATARAGVIVVSHGLGDVNRYAVSGAFVVQLWHGIPLKRIGLDSPATVRSALLPDSVAMRRLLGMLYRRTVSAIRVLPAASHLVRGRLESAFGLPDEKVLVTGEPRVDVLSAGDAATRYATARALLDTVVGPLPDEVVLYAPTWRDGEADPAVPSAAEWQTIDETLSRQNAVLLIRSHPLGAGAYTPPFATDRIRLLGSDVLRDVTPALPGLTVLITDYSSLAYDVGLVPLPALFLAPDEQDYATRRGFYGRYRDVAGDDVAADWSTVMAQLDALLAEPDERARRLARSERISARVHAFRDGGNTARVYREIVRRFPRAHGEGRR